MLITRTCWTCSVHVAEVADMGLLQQLMYPMYKVERHPGFCIQSSSHISRIPTHQLSAKIISENNDIITTRKRSLGQGNIFTPVSHSVHGGGRAWLLPGGVRGFIWGVCMVLFGGACVVFSVFSDIMRYGQ